MVCSVHWAMPWLQEPLPTGVRYRLKRQRAEKLNGSVIRSSQCQGRLEAAWW